MAQQNMSDPDINKPTKRKWGLLYGLSAGHAVKHFGQGAVLLLVPEVKAALSLSDFAVGAMFGAQEASAGVTNVPAGLLSDMYRRRVPLLLITSMSCVAFGYFLIGISYWYALTLLALIFIGAGTSLWHAPAFSELAVRYPERRGFAMAAHLTGAQIGNTTAPIGIGLLLGGISYAGIEWAGLDWRLVAFLLVIPAIITAFLIFIKFKSPAQDNSIHVDLRSYFSASARLLQNSAVLAQAFLHALRGASHTSIQLFLVIYMSEELEYSEWMIGVHVALLTLAGIVATPVLGSLSDRFGRRIVSTVAMCGITVFTLGFLWADTGLALTINVILLGVFLFSIMPVIVAAAMDATDQGSEGTSVAILFAGGALIGAFAPAVAGAINDRWDFSGVVLFVAFLAGAGALIAFLAPRKRINTLENTA